VKTKNKNMAGQLKVKINFLFFGGNSGTVVLRQMKFGTVKDDGLSYTFYLNNNLL
jgi:hypothetical protein